MRKCKKCETVKSLECFEVYQPSKGWRRHECRECVKVRVNHWTSQSKLRIKEMASSVPLKDEAARKAASEKAAAWNRANPERHAANSLAHYYRLQYAAIMAYGGYVCSCCGETEPMFLSLDHVNNDGKQHRAKLGTLGGAKFYKGLRDRGYPEGFTVLCMNCNQGRHRNGGVCPHKEGATTIPKGSRPKRAEAPAVADIFGDYDMVCSASEDAAARKGDLEGSVSR